MLLKLPCFGTTIPAISALDKATIDSIHALRKALIDSSHYNSSLRPRPGASGKHNHAGWIRFFYGIKHPAIDGQREEDRVHEKGPSYGSPLELAALIAFWLDRFIFPGPSCDTLSSGIFLWASLLARGIRLPLASLFLGGLYTRLDQIPRQLKASFGRYNINCYMDQFFLLTFLCERFKGYVPKPKLPRGFNVVRRDFTVPRAWAWINAKPKCLLATIIDDGSAFQFRPYLSDILGYESPSHLYGFTTSQDLNDLSRQHEGVHDFWRLCCGARTLPGLVITDNMIGPSSGLCSCSYRPDRVARQFGWDQLPACLSWEVDEIKDVLSRLTLVDPPRGGNDDANEYFLPAEEKYAYGVSPAWLSLHIDMLEHLRRCEAYDPLRWHRPFPPSSRGIDIIHGDPYYSLSGISHSEEGSSGKKRRDKGKKRIASESPPPPSKHSRSRPFVQTPPSHPHDVTNAGKAPRSASPVQTPVGGNFALLF